jgi:hypothetical protein
MSWEPIEICGLKPGALVTWTPGIKSTPDHEDPDLVVAIMFDEDQTPCIQTVDSKGDIYPYCLTDQFWEWID